MAKKKDEIEELDLSRTDDAGVPYADPNAPAVVKDREANYDKGMEAQADAEERQKIADGIAQEKAQREAKNAKATNVGDVQANATNQVAPPINKAVQQNGAVQPTRDVNSAMSQVEGAVGSNPNIKSATAGMSNSRSSKNTGYGIEVLNNAQDTNSNQQTKSANISSGETTQAQKTEFDPNKAKENVAAIDPFLAKVDRDGAAKAFLDVYGEKPSPDALNNAAELARKKNKMATISESIRVLFDMASAASGGNVYKRDEIQKNIQENKAELEKEKVKYQAALDKFNDGLMGAKGTDLTAKRALMNDAIKAGYSTRGEGTSNQSSVANSNTKSQQSTKGKHEQVVNDKESDYQRSMALGAASRGEKNTQVITTVVNPKTGKTEEQLYAQFTPTEWAAVRSRASLALSTNPEVIKKAATQYHVSEDVIRKALLGKYSAKEEVGLNSGTMSYDDFGNDIVRNFAMQDDRARNVLNYKKNQVQNPNDLRSGTIEGNQMTFTGDGNQPPVSQTSVTPAWQTPQPGSNNAQLDDLFNSL